MGRQFIVFWICLFFIFCLVYSESQEVKNIYIFDFGKVKEGIILEHKFLWINNSDRIVKIKELSTSCGCTVSEITKKELLPSESTEIYVKFNTQGYSGKVEQSVFMYTDDPENEIIKFNLKAEVLKEVD